MFTSPRVYIFLSVLICLSSCTPVIKMIYGVKNPKPKTDEQVIQYSNKLFDKEYDMYRPVDSTAYNALTDLKLNSLPGIVFFDSDGNQKSIHKDTLEHCTASADVFIRHLNLLDDAPSMNLNKSDILQYVHKINFKDKKEEQRDYKNSIIIFWADWIGPKLNKQATRDWLQVYSELAQKNQDNIDLKIINVDSTENYVIHNCP